MLHQLDAKRYGKALVGTLALLLAMSIILMWGWNTVAVELLRQEPMAFRHAVALEASLVAVAMVLPLAHRLAGRHP